MAKRIKEINETQKLQGYMFRRPGGSKNYFVTRAAGARGGFRRGHYNHISTTTRVRGWTDQTSTEGVTEAELLYSMPKRDTKKGNIYGRLCHGEKIHYMSLLV